MTHDLKRYLLLASAVALMAGCHKTPAASDSSAAVPPDSTAVAAASSSASDASATPVNPPATTPATPAAPDFVQKAAVSDMFEIESSKLALKRSSNPQVKAFARMMIKDHTESTAKLKAAIATSGQSLTPPSGLPEDKQMALNDLANADAKAFDKAYLDAQVDGHTQALSLLTNYAANGDTPALKAFAGAVVPTVQHHLDHAKALQASLS